MPTTQPVQPFEHEGFLGGLNRQADPYRLNMNESPDALNVDFGDRGEVTKRKGYTQKWADANVSEHIFEFLSDKIVHVRDNGNIRYISAGTSVDSTKTLTDSTDARSYPIPGVQLDYNLYLTRFTNDNPVRWDGTTWTDMTQWDGADTTTAYPNAAVATYAHNRVFAGNVRLSGGTEHHSRFYFSDPIDPEGWQALNYFDVAPDDGTEIRAMQLFGDQILVFKDHSIYVVVGVNELEFDVWPLDNSLGVGEGGRSVAIVHEQLFFFDPNKGIYAFDGGGFDRISDRINDYLLDGINSTYAYKAYGFGYRNRYYLSVPWDTSTVNNRMFVWDPHLGEGQEASPQGAWQEYDYGVSGFAETAANGNLAVGVNGGNHIMEMFTGTDDNGASIAAHVKTAWMSPASPSYKHRARRMDITFSALGDYNVTVKMYEDFSPNASVIKSANTLGSGDVYGTALYGTGTYGKASDQIISRTSGWSKRWRTAQFEFVESGTGTFQVNRMIMLYSANYRSRGEAY